MNKNTKEDLIIDWNELEAYRTLNGQSFDFGTGLITDDSKLSEDTYLKMQQWDIENALDNLEDNNKIYKQKKYKRRKSRTKDIDIKKLKKLANISWFPVSYSEDKERYLRYYVSGRRKYAKWCSDRAVRNRNDFPLKGGGYRKVFDYWWVIF